jgi:hypothetical protein
MKTEEEVEAKIEEAEKMYDNLSVVIATEFIKKRPDMNFIEERMKLQRSIFHQKIGLYWVLDK